MSDSSMGFGGRLGFALLLASISLACGQAEGNDATSTDAVTSRQCSVLVVMSDARTLHAVGTTFPSFTRDYEFGFLLDEMAIPVNALLDAGCRVTYTNPTGTEPPRDPEGDSPIYFTDGLPSAQVLLRASPTEALTALTRIVPDAQAHAELDRALALVTSPTSPVRGRGPGSFDSPLPFATLLDEQGRAADAKLASYSAVFVPGGYAPMLNLWNDRQLGAILRWFHENARTTATLCRGGVALASTAEGGAFAYAGYRMTTYSTIEDDVASLLSGVLPFYDLPFHPNEKVRAAGARVEFVPFKAHVVEDRELITGENQFSAHLLAKHLLERVRSSR